jgi:organic radical activating enzyme
VAHPRCGLVVSGGEPLIHYANENVLAFLDRIDVFLPWQSLETSGYVGKALTAAQCQRFFRRFDTVSFSPKVTPCLTGPKGEHEYDQNVAAILEALAGRERKTCVKLVVRDDHDLLAVAQFDDFFQVRKRGFQIHVMPYGQEPEEILAACRWLVPHLADMGYVLTPRLHSILWGKKRGV